VGVFVAVIVALAALAASPVIADTPDAQAVAAALARIPALQGIRLDGVTKLAQGRNAYSVRLGT
jgi:hypothetical protein